MKAEAPVSVNRTMVEEDPAEIFATRVSVCRPDMIADGRARPSSSERPEYRSITVSAVSGINI
jgi:hypothetical protein